MDKENGLIALFDSLSEFYKKENDLSNITYSVCKADEKFRKFFLGFCFDEELDVLDLTIFRREVPSENGESRVDLYFFDNKKQERLIEVKINDKNIHDEYEINYKNAKKCFLSAYRLDFERDGWIQKTWKDFYLRLKNEKYFDDNALVKAYAEYLKMVVGIKEFEHMELNLSNLPKFIDNTATVLENYNYSEYHSSSKSFDKNYYGNYYIADMGIAFWMGIYLPDSKLYIIFYDNWMMKKKVKNVLNNLDGKKTDTYSCHYEVSDVAYYFCSQKFEINDYCSKDIKEQKEILEEFIEAVFNDVGLLAK